MNTALKLLWRDWKGGELNILILSLLVAIATVTSIGLFTDRIKNTIQSEAGNLLAADAQVRGSMDVGGEWRNQARSFNLEMADTVGFRAMAFSDEGAQLASVKAVSDSYPLKGHLQISNQPYGVGEKVTQGPEPGEVWLASRLFGSLAVEVGDTVAVGERDFLITAALISEPDSAQSFFGVGPRIMMHMDDMAGTGAVQTGSRINYRWLLAGNPKQVESMQQWLNSEDRIGKHHRWVGVKGSNQGVTSAMDRAESFLLLAGSLGVVLAGTALALAARRYSHRQISHVALLKTLGMSPNQVTQLYLVNLVVLAGLTITLGLLIGWGIHWSFIHLFDGLLPSNLAAADNRPYWVGAISGFISLMAFAAPPILALRQIPPARVLRSDVGGVLNQRWSFVIGLVAMVGLVYWYSANWFLTLALTGGALVCLVGITFVAGILIRLSRRYAAGLGNSWRIGLASLYRHSRQNSLQIMIFSVSLLLLFVLVLVRTSLISNWQDQLPEGTANHFAFNIFDQELEGIIDFFNDNEITANPFYPMVRGRIAYVEGTSVGEIIEQNEPDGDDYRRELNLTWGDTLGADNEIISGSWWQPGDEDKTLVSLEQEFAEDLGIEVGDSLTFSVSGSQFDAQVASLRKVKWDSMNPNFYAIFSGPILGGASASLLTSFYLAPEQKPLLNDLLLSHPTITLIEVDQMIAQVQGIIGQVTSAIEFILALVLVSGVLVLIASIQATLDSRFQESAILRTIGAKGGMVRGALLIEFGTLGWLAGLLAVVGAESTMGFLQSRMFEMEFSFNTLLWLIGPWIGMILIGAIGMLSTRKVIQTPPLMVLRNI